MKVHIMTSHETKILQNNALLDTVYFYNCKVLGLRNNDEHRNLKCAQIQNGLGEKKKSTCAVHLSTQTWGSRLTVRVLNI